MPGRSVDILLNARDNMTPAFNTAGRSAGGFLKNMNGLKGLVTGGVIGLMSKAVVRFGIDSVNAFAESEKASKQFKASIDELAASWGNLKLKAGEAMSGPVMAMINEMKLLMGLSGRGAIDKGLAVQNGNGFDLGNGLHARLARLRAQQANAQVEGEQAQGRLNQRAAVNPFLKMLPGAEIGNMLGGMADQRRVRDAAIVKQNLERQQLLEMAKAQAAINRGVRPGQMDMFDPIINGVPKAIQALNRFRVEGVNRLDELNDRLQAVADRGRALAELRGQLDGAALGIREQVNPALRRAREAREVRQMVGLNMLTHQEAIAFTRQQQAQLAFSGNPFKGGERLVNQAMEMRGLKSAPFTDTKRELKTLEEIAKEAKGEKEWRDKMLRAVEADPATANKIIEIRSQLN